MERAEDMPDIKVRILEVLHNKQSGDLKRKILFGYPHNDSQNEIITALGNTIQRTIRDNRLLPRNCPDM